MDIIPYLPLLDTIFAFTFLPAMMAILFSRTLKQHKETSRWNWVRILLLLTVSTDFVNMVIKFLWREYRVAFLSGLMTADANGSSPMAFSNGIIVMLGIMLAAYLNRRDEYLLVGVFAQIGCIIMYYALGMYQFEEYYLYIFGPVAIIALYETSIRVKDNYGMGFAIFYTLQFSTLLEIGPWGTLLSLTAYVFGFFLALGKFRLFKKEEY
ncbi:MAG: hypothetical protein ACTSVZ_11535 [Promethearchaeota archaeon]